MRQRIITRAVILALGACGAGDLAPAAAADDGMFSITPARRSVETRPPADLVPTVVANTTAETYRVRVFPVLLQQTLAGPFVFSEQPGALRDARNVLSVGSPSFTLRPGARRTVGLRWNVLPEGRHQIPVGVVFQGTPSGQRGQQVRTISRLLSLNFLRDPRARPARGRIVGFAVRPDATRPRRLLLVARVRNVGGSVARPCDGLVRVRDARGKVVRRARWRGDVVVPGAVREFAVPVGGKLRAGAYQAAVRMCFGKSRRLRAVTRFRLVGTNLLPSPALTLRAFNAAGSPGEEARARGTFVSTGTAPASSDVVVRLYERSGTRTVGPPVHTARIRVRGLAAGRRTPLDVALGKVEPGQYRAVVTYTAAPGRRATATSNFAPLAQRSAADRAWDWITANLGWLVAAVLALLLVLGRRRRREPVPDAA